MEKLYSRHPSKPSYSRVLALWFCSGSRALDYCRFWWCTVLSYVLFDWLVTVQTSVYSLSSRCPPTLLSLTHSLAPPIWIPVFCSPSYTTTWLCSTNLTQVGVCLELFCGSTLSPIMGFVCCIAFLVTDFELLIDFIIVPSCSWTLPLFLPPCGVVVSSWTVAGQSAVHHFPCYCDFRK